MKTKVKTTNVGETDAGRPVKFFLGPSWSIQARLGMGIAVILLGILLPFLFLPWILGALMILAGGVLLAPRGLSNKPARLDAEGEWKEVSEEEIRRIKEMTQRCRRWGASLLDGNTARGVGVLAAVCIVAAGAATLFIPADWWPGLAFLGATATPHLPEVFVLDVILLAIPLWFFGLKSRFEPRELLLKIEALENILDRLDIYPADGWKTKILLEFTPCEKGTIPTDARLSLAPEDAPDDFIGIQVQVSLNDVQGTKYPYLYAVVLARETFGLFDAEFPRSAKEVFERETSDDVDVVVVRQRTSKTSGYHTKAKDQVRVFESTLALAESALTTASS